MTKLYVVKVNGYNSENKLTTLYLGFNFELRAYQLMDTKLHAIGFKQYAEAEKFLTDLKKDNPRASDAEIEEIII